MVISSDSMAEAFEQGWSVLKDGENPVGSDCPNCAETGRVDGMGKPGRIVWRGGNKHRGTHSRCNFGCVVPPRDPEPESKT